MKRLSFALLFLVACKPAATPPPDQPGNPDGLPTGNGGPEASQSAAECEAAGGNVVGDIGDGAIFKPDYVCESNGEPPTARITAEEGGPIGVEGSVCCGG
ncbi:MAG: hypothetical protein ACRBN8_39555 [Nannocystales bacterium]